MLFRNTFYYGTYEYPRKSGNWHTGRHEPLVNKELFDLVQEQIKINIIRTYGKEFAFTKLMTCGLCGSSISADEKFRKQKNGNIHHYVYYGCAKRKDSNCKNGYIEEKELVMQFESLIDKVNLDEIGIKDKIKIEIERFKKFQKLALMSEEEIQITNIDIRNYAKYILREAPNTEKRELLTNLKGKISLINKLITLD